VTPAAAVFSDFAVDAAPFDRVVDPTT